MTAKSVALSVIVIPQTSCARGECCQMTGPQAAKLLIPHTGSFRPDRAPGNPGRGAHSIRARIPQHPVPFLLAPGQVLSIRRASALLLASAVRRPAAGPGRPGAGERTADRRPGVLLPRRPAEIPLDQDECWQTDRSCPVVRRPGARSVSPRVRFLPGPPSARHPPGRSAGPVPRPAHVSSASRVTLSNHW